MTSRHVVPALIAVLVALAACGGAKPEPKSAALPEASSPSKPTTGHLKMFEPGGQGGEVPPEIAQLMRQGPCTPVMHGAAAAHTRDVEQQGGGTVRTFFLEPGERLCLVGEMGVSNLAIWSDTVPESQAKGRLVSVELQRIGADTVLLVKNTHDRPLTYRAVMKVPGGGPQPTSVCPVRPNLLGLEHWPHAVEGVMVGAFQLHDPGDKLRCE